MQAHERFARALAALLADGRRELMAHQQLGDACHQLRLATVAPGEALLPMKSWRQASLDQPAARIAEARAKLEDATRF